VTAGKEPLGGEPYYIQAASPAADLSKLVLKHDEAFFVADQRGDLLGLRDGEFGYYQGGTRFLRQLELLVNGQRPIVLNAATSDDGLQVAVDLTNADARDGEEIIYPGRSLHVARRLTLDRHALLQELVIETFATGAQPVVLTWRFAADFADVFEVRGFRRERRGQMRAGVIETDGVILGYRGLDGMERRTRLAFAPAPDHLESGGARHRLHIAAGERLVVRVIATALNGAGARTPAAPPPFAELLARRERAASRSGIRRVEIRTSDDRLDRWIERSRLDLQMLVTDTRDGPVPYAGIPWYVAPFGRDSAITALQLLPFAPELARGTLRFLARHQGRTDDAFTDQEPGKILHEYRRGELARCREIAFLPYYGSVDATPLFLMLLAEYVRWTGDLELARALWPNALAALDWMRRNGERAGSLLSYQCRSPRGLVNQGWKDSWDAVMQASGALAIPPIAPVEAQGYKVAALDGAAELARRLGDADTASAFAMDVRTLQQRIEERYWMDGEQFYALAIDADGAPCEVITSNPAHCLWSGAIDAERARLVARRLLDADMFSGWGLRTLSTRERRYNPMSYHNGSVWPHDTAIAAAGLRRYGLTESFLVLTTGLFEAVLGWDDLRMPELFCGFARRPGYGPTRYPAACSPQAWSSGVAFHLLGSLLGLDPDAAANRLTLRDPVLPEWLEWIEVRGLPVRDSRIDVRLSRGKRYAAVEMLDRRGDAEIVVVRR
jgi:glycogen debranching enzyme